MMDKEYYMNAGIPTPHPVEFEAIMPIGWNGLNCSEEQSFLDPNPAVDQYSQFESALSSMVSSPVASISGLSNEAFVLRELIGKLGGIGNSIAFPSTATTVVARGSSNNPNNDSCYSTPLSSPPKLKLPILDHVKVPNLGNSVPLTPLPSFSTDPGFAERAAKFSCFGTWSFNGRASPFGMSNAELVHRSSSQLMGNGKLSRVSSSPSLKQDGSPVKNQNLSQPQMEMTPINQTVTGSDKKLIKLSDSFANSNEESSVSEQIPSAETGSKTSNELNSRKRKPISRGKSKEDGSTSAKGVNGNDDANAKRSKPTESGKIENNGGKTEEEAKGGSNDENDKQKTNQKPPEPPKDYIHVRARRGQATDSHSLAERVRREKISERMKLLQDLVPGCNKVTGKALMLDEIINYVQSLQRQVEFLSMKLASVNPGLDFNMENLLSKETFQQNATLPQQMYPLDSSTPAFLNHQPHQIPQQLHNNNASSRPLTQNLSLDGFDFPEFGEGDLHSIFQMGFAQNAVNFPVPIPNQTPNMMKLER